MLTQKQIEEIKEHLDKAQNPLFFFDNDPDGLCSFLLLQRYLGRGRGVAAKSYPDLSVDYFRKVQELEADYIFILDKPLVSKEFFKKVEQVNIPVVWIDHHGDQGGVPEFVNYYDPVLNDPPSNEPVTALCYDITRRKEDIWLAVIGCIADAYLPDFYDDFMKKYPDLGIKTKKPYDVFYKSQIGKITKIMGNGLKDRTSNVMNMLRFLMKVKSPYDILEENSKTRTIHQRFNFIEQKYQRILERAKSLAGEKKILFFKYGGDLSISGELANELCYLYPEKVIVVAYVKQSKVNLSIRGRNIRGATLESIKGLENATGGGHKDAVGVQVKIEDLEKFKKNLIELLDRKI